MPIGQVMITESFPPKLPDPIRALYPFRTRMLHVFDPAARAAAEAALSAEGPAAPVGRMPGDSAEPL